MSVTSAIICQRTAVGREGVGSGFSEAADFSSEGGVSETRFSKSLTHSEELE